MNDGNRNTRKCTKYKDKPVSLLSPSDFLFAFARLPAKKLCWDLNTPTETVDASQGGHVKENAKCLTEEA